MSKSSKIKAVLCALCLIGGIGNIGQNTGAAIFGIVVAAGLALWVALDFSKNKQNIKKEKDLTHSNPIEKNKTVSFSIPKRIGNAWKCYCYPNVSFLPDDGAYDIALEMQKNNNWKLEIGQSDINEISLNYQGKKIGILADKKRAEMIEDWVKRNDPYLIYLNHLGEPNSVLVVFYKDKESELQYRESKIVKLTKSYNQDAQLFLMDMENGEPLEAEEEDDETVAVSNIGYLPKTDAIRYIQDGASGIFVDHIDYDDEKDKYIPYAKIYW